MTTQTKIVAGAGEDVATALQTLAAEMDKLNVAAGWEMKHFTICQETKIHPMDPRSVKLLYYAVAVVIVPVKSAAENFAEQ